MKRGTPRHPKMRDLCDQLNCTLPLAVGYLELLWHFTAEFAPQGDIGRYSDKRIEGALDWRKSPGGLVRAMVASGWLDSDPEVRLTVHDWHEHADDSVRKRLQRSDLQFVTHTVKVTGQRQKMSATLPDKIRLPEPLPEPEPEPLPEPEPEAPPPPARVVSVREIMPRITDMAARPAQGFEEVWDRWPRKMNRDSAGRDWISHVTVANVDKVLACVDRYLASEEVSRGVVKNLGTTQDREGWITAAARDKWESDWPRGRSVTAAKPTVLQSLIEKTRKEAANART